MKVTKVTNKSQVSFQPITLELVIESEEEARALYAICNHCDNINLLPGLRDIKEHFLQGYKVTHQSEVIANGVTYKQWYV